jgi:hypothetical protein
MRGRKTHVFRKEISGFPDVFLVENGPRLTGVRPGRGRPSMIANLAFTTPLLLVALLALPVLWWLLRAVPPAPIRRRFPGVALLLGLKDDDSQTDKTPWWLLLLRMLALAAAIVGFAGPVLNPQTERAGDGPLLIVMDASWASARDWSDRTERVGVLLDEAGRAARPVALVALTDLPAGEPAFQSASAWSRAFRRSCPRPSPRITPLRPNGRGPRSGGRGVLGLRRSCPRGAGRCWARCRTSARSRFSRAGGT